MRRGLLAAWLLARVAVFDASAASPEDFDLSGVPGQPGDFAEQRLLDALRHHKAGDVEDARLIQRMLADYYRARGDEKRAEAASKLAEPPPPAAGRAKPPASPEKAQAPEKSRSPKAAAFEGRFFGMEGRLLHTWDFLGDGTFLHTTVASGAGTSSRTSERGAFEVQGQYLILKVAKTAGAYAAPGVGGRSTQLGGDVEEKPEVRRVKFKRTPGGCVIDGIKLKPKSW